VRIHILSHSPSFTFGIATPFCCSVCNYYYYSSSPLSACLHRSLSHTQPPSDLMQAERRENQRLFTHTQTIIKPHERNAKKEVAIAADKRELRRTVDSQDALQLNVDCLFTNSSINRNCNCLSPFWFAQVVLSNNKYLWPKRQIRAEQKEGGKMIEAQISCYITLRK